jgi:hypothetical protein
MKTCGACRSEKPASDFYADKRRRDGLKGQCKRCHCRTSIDSVRVDVQPEAGPSAVLVLTVAEALTLAALLERAIAEAAR